MFLSKSETFHYIGEICAKPSLANPVYEVKLYRTTECNVISSRRKVNNILSILHFSRVFTCQNLEGIGQMSFTSNRCWNGFTKNGITSTETIRAKRMHFASSIWTWCQAKLTKWGRLLLAVAAMTKNIFKLCTSK